MSTARIPRRIFYILWVDGTPTPLVESTCFPEALVKDLAIEMSRRTQKDVFILKATHCTYASTLTDIEVKELPVTDPFGPKEEL
ncbi:hypothetical protein LCGC14_2827870 [marine sediment metagenome]|uniref:Uncharacterized protein n=1 Tax=marine sediment metagenome TaxID=412755 RepID=A0A0F9B640_9ZZZZ